MSERVIKVKLDATGAVEQSKNAAQQISQAFSTVKSGVNQTLKELNSAKAGVGEVGKATQTSMQTAQTASKQFNDALKSQQGVVTNLKQKVEQLTQSIHLMQAALRSKNYPEEKKSEVSQKLVEAQAQKILLQDEIKQRQIIIQSVQSQASVTTATANAQTEAQARVTAAAKATAAAEEDEGKVLDTLEKKYRSVKEEMSRLYADGQQNSNAYKNYAAEAVQYKQALDQLNAAVKPEKQATLRSELSRVKAEMDKLVMSGKQNTEEYRQLQTEARKYDEALRQLNADTKPEKQATLSSQLAAVKKRMNELAAAGQQGSAEYKQLSAEAKQYDTALKQLNVDAKADVQVKLRTELLNAKQAMVEAERAFGRGSVQYQQAAAHATALQQQQNALNKSLKAMASPTATYQGIISGMSGISGVVSAATGAMSLFGGENQKTAAAMQKLQSIMSITMGLQSMSTALNKNSALRLNVVGRLTEWWAGCVAKATAAKTANTAAVAANTAATGAAAATTTAAATATTGATAATTAYAFSWRALGVAIKSVPVFGWVLAAASAVIAIFVKLTNRMTTMQKNYKALGEAIKSTSGEYIKEKNALEQLYKAATNTNNAQQLRLVAVQRLKQQYPEYFKKLRDEAILTGQAADEYKRLTENMKQAAIARGMQNVINEKGEQIAQWYSDHSDEAGWLGGANRQRFLSLRDTITPEVIGTYRSYLNLAPSSLKASQALAELEGKYGVADMVFMNEYYKRYEAYQAAFKKDTKDAFAQIEYLSKQLNAISDQFKLTPTEEELRAQNAGDILYWQRKMDEAQGIYGNSNYTAEEWEQARAAYEEAKKKYDELTLSSTSSETSETSETSTTSSANTEQRLADQIGKRRTAIQQYTTAVTEEIRKSELEIAKARIDNMNDGFDKTYLTIEYNYNKLISENQARLNSMIEALAENRLNEWRNANPAATEAQAQAYKRSLLDPTSANALTKGDLTAAQQSVLDRYDELAAQQRDNALRKLLQTSRQAWTDYLAEYGTFEQQRYAIAQEYAAKIAEVQQSSDTPDMKANKIRLLETERDNKLGAVQTDLFGQVNWGQTFEGIGNVLAEAARQMLDKLDEYMLTAEYKNLTAANKKKYTDLRERLLAETGSNEAAMFNFGIWSEIGTLAEQYRQSVDNLNVANDAHRAALAELAAAETALAENTDDTAKEMLQAAVDAAKGKVESTGAAVNTAQEGVTQSEGALRTATDKAADGLNKFKACVDEINDGSLYGFANGISKFITGLSGTAKGLSELGGKVGGLIGAILQILDALGDDPDKFITDLLDKVNEAVSNILDDLPEIVLHLVRGIFNIIGNVFKGAWGLFGVNIGGIFNNSNAQEVQDTIDRLTERNELLQTAIEDLTEEIKSSKGTKSVSAYREAYDFQKEQQQNLLDIAAAQASYHGSHHSWNAYWGGFTAEEIRRISTQIGRTWDGQLWSLSPEEMKKLRSNIDIWTRMQDTGEGGYGERLTEKLDAYIDEAGKLEELTEQLYEGLTGVSFDSMYDSFIDTLMDMDASAEDFADNLTEYFTRAMISNKIGELYADKLEEWWNKFGKSMEDGTLTEAEREALSSEYMGYVDEAMKLRDEIVAATGYDPESSASGSGTSKGFATASQDSVDELSGRAAAILTSGEMRRQLLLGINIDTTAIRNQIAANAENATEIRNLSLIGVQHLEAIAKNTQELFSINERLDKIERNTRQL